MVFKCLLGTSHLNASGSKPGLQVAGEGCLEHLGSAMGSPASNLHPLHRPNRSKSPRMLRPSPPPAAGSDPHGDTDAISPLSSTGVPGQGSPGRAAWGRVPAHSIISRSGSSSLATQTEPQHGLGKQIRRRRHHSSGGEPGVPTAGRCHCPALPRESTRTPSCVAGKARRRLCCSVSSRASHRRGWREPETSSAPRGGQGALAPCSPPPSALTQTSAQ